MCFFQSSNQARIQGGGAFGARAPPPLEPNTQRKNLRRLKDLRGQIQQKLQNFQNEFFFFFFFFLLKTFS